MKFQFIDDNKHVFPPAVSAKLLGVSKSGFYKWKSAGGTRTKENLKLLRVIENIHKSSRKSYGSPRIFKQLKALGTSVSKAKVERLMREHGIRAKMKRKFKATTNSRHNHPVAENRLNREFNPSAPNRVWAGDVTYVWTEEGWLYLAVILDLFSRQVVGWAMSERLTADLALRALTMALVKRRPPAGLIHHSDQGSQYASGDYQRVLKRHGIICSMSRKANCWDNAVVESFFHTLKTEMIYFERFNSRAEATTQIFEWIEVFYNRQRLHSSLAYHTPEQYEHLTNCA